LRLAFVLNWEAYLFNPITAQTMGSLEDLSALRIQWLRVAAALPFPTLRLSPFADATRGDDQTNVNRCSRECFGNYWHMQKQKVGIAGDH